MPQQVKFIGRHKELSQIETLVSDMDTRCVVSIKGEGGIGKTRLLQEIRNRYIDVIAVHNENITKRELAQSHLLVADIIDFDDRTLQVAQELGRRIAHTLGEGFESYLRRLSDYRKIELAGVSGERLAEEYSAINEAFIDDFNTVSAHQRVILFFDTVDALKGVEIQDYLPKILPHLRNFILLMAGRKGKLDEIETALCHLLNKDLYRINLASLDLQASQAYLNEKQKLLHTILPPGLAQKLLLLADGRPILIDLAIEWQARDTPLPWLENSSLKELKSLPVEAIHTKQQEFEKRLLQRIEATRRPIDWLILMLARVYPLDEIMVSKLLGESRESARTLIREAKTYTFIKSLPDDRIVLHDEMRRMVREHVWPKFDPDGDLARANSKVAIKHFKVKINTLTDKIEHLIEQEKNAHDIQKEIVTFNARADAEQELWALREQLLFHTLVVDPDAGILKFIEMFDQATHAYQFISRELLLNQMQRYIASTNKKAPDRPSLSKQQEYEVTIRYAKHLLDRSLYAEAHQQLEAIVLGELSPEQQTDIHIQRANIKIRLGKFQQGIEHFQLAVKISREHNLETWLAKAETGLGWAYRLTANLEEARKHYQTALNLAKEVKSTVQQAYLYNNLGFVYAYIPRYRDLALSYCNSSLSIWEDLNDQRGIGRSYSTLGCVTFMMGQYTSALNYYRKALEIFEPADDREWLSIVYSWRGATYMSMGELDLAEQDLKRSLGLQIQKDRTINLSRIGQLYMFQKKLEKAQKAIEECHKLAMRLPDVWYQLVSLRDMARLAFGKKDYNRLEEFENLLQDYLNTWEAQDLRALGMLYLYLGRLALGLSDTNKALEHLKKGLKLLAELGQYGNDTTIVYVDRLQKAMLDNLHLTPEQICKIGTTLLAFWQNEGFNILHPDVGLRLSKWENWEGD